LAELLVFALAPDLEALTDVCDEPVVDVWEFTWPTDVAINPAVTKAVMNSFIYFPPLYRL
jgi:hypothetical protein